MPNKPPKHRSSSSAGIAGGGEGRSRLSSTQRGYDGRWRRARVVFLRRNPLCLYCSRVGKEELASLVDHNPPHFGDMERFWDLATWVPCCAACHNLVTAAFDGGGGNLVRAREGRFLAPMVGEVN